MEHLDYRKLFDVGAEITLSRKFYKDVEREEKECMMGCLPWKEDCIKMQRAQGHLKVVEVKQNYIKVKGCGYNDWMLCLDYINLHQLEPYRDNDNFDILYAFANNQAAQHYKRNLSVPLENAFSWKCTPEGADYWDKVFDGKKIVFKKSDSHIPIKENKETTNKSKQEPIQEAIQNKNNHEIRLQKQKAVVIRGTRPKGSRICCSEHKVTIRSRQISYKACHC